MGLHHFFVDPAWIEDGTVEIKGEEAHHAWRVLRLRPGEAVTVADGTGRVVEAVVRSLGDPVRAEVVAERKERRPLPLLTLYQGLARAARMDALVERAAELGVARVVPFVAERTLVRWDASQRAAAVRRWQRVARAAAKQSRSPWLTVVEGVGDRPPLHADVVLHEEATRRLRDVLPPQPPGELSLVVGPEGGLTCAEVRELVQAGAAAASLGERILRTELAGPVAAALVAFVYGSLG